MMTLLTGLPGNGKTLFAIWFVKKYVESENKRLKSESDKTGAALVVRQVFYAGINDLTLPWTQIDPTKWMDCPPGSIIVLDECQDVFPKKPSGSNLPAHYEKLAKHRHSGFDIFLITQHPSLIDNFVRKLVGRHFHSIRKFGMQRSTVYEWSSASNSPESPASQKSSIPLKWKYPAEVYTYYKSAEVHTVKRSIPLKVILAALFVVAMVFAFYFALDSYQNRYKKSTVPASSAGAAAVSSGAGSSSSSGPFGEAAAPAGAARVDPVEDAKRFVFESTPRLVGLPHTAPKYDQMTRPVRVPVPAMCIRKKLMCKCFTQQGTVIQVPTNMCYEIAYSGFFQEFNPDGGVDPGKQQQQQQPARQVESQQVASLSPAVVVMPDSPNSSVYPRTSSK